MERRLTYRIRGMDCAEETLALKGTVGGLSGVTDLHFNLLKGQMQVICSRDIPSEEDIRRAVEAAGLEIEAEGSCPTGVCAVEPNPWRKNGRTLMCAASGILTGLGFLTHWLAHGSLLDALTAGEALETHSFPWLSIALYGAAAIMGGWFIAPKAWSAARRLRPDMNLLMTVAVIGAATIGQ